MELNSRGNVKGMDPVIDVEIWEIATQLNQEQRKKMLEITTKAEGYSIIEGKMFKEVNGE